ncbi:hypothetical protein [Anaeromyxobacter soli]|uniref:hypothetical protein n=1 Tax=Anaeromyxobacter soli TaxID=2922725 RepID=UPI001FAE8BB1|nr:hypothetical protein [Anaeromyxobacter sp. SG29]
MAIDTAQRGGPMKNTRGGDARSQKSMCRRGKTLASLLAIVAFSPASAQDPRAAFPAKGALKLPSPQDPQRFHEVRRSALSHIQKLSSAIDEIYPRMREVSKHLSALQAEEEQKADNEAAESKVFKKYPALAAIGIFKGYRFEGFVTDPKELRGRADIARAWLRRARTCGEALGNQISPAPAECTTLLSCSDDIGADADGLFRYDLSSEFEIAKTRIDSPRQFRYEGFEKIPSDADSALAEKEALAFDSCRLVSELTKFEPTNVHVVQRQRLHFVLWAREFKDFQKHCSTPRDVNPVHARLVALSQQFPEDEDVKKIVEQSREWCGGMAKEHCKSVYEVRETWALAYLTEACSIRKVTTKDVTDDVQQWRGATDAEKQEHLELADLINACAAANKAGFDWSFEKPEETGCRSSARQTENMPPRRKRASSSP